MEQSYQSPIADYAISEYRLVIAPHALLAQEINAIKKKFASTYDCSSALSNQLPNILLARFEQFEVTEKRILHRLELLAAAHPAFMVELNGFGSEPTHTIYINLGTKTQIISLVKSFRSIQSLLTMDKDHKPHFITEPTVTIANKLLPWQYEKGWLELQHTHFSGMFLVNQLIMLRKRKNGNAFEIIKKFSFLNEKNFIRQGELFTNNAG